MRLVTAGLGNKCIYLGDTISCVDTFLNHIDTLAEFISRACTSITSTSPPTNRVSTISASDFLVTSPQTTFNQTTKLPRSHACRCPRTLNISVESLVASTFLPNMVRRIHPVMFILKKGAIFNSTADMKKLSAPSWALLLLRSCSSPAGMRLMTSHGPFRLYRHANTDGLNANAHVYFLSCLPLLPEITTSPVLQD